MPYTQKDIVKVKVAFSDGGELVHPVIIISCDSACSHENNRVYIGVMITHATNRDKFTFELKKDMIDGNWGEAFSQVRLHIIVRFKESDISRDATRYLGKIKKVYFKEIVEQITSYVFRVD